MNFTEIVHLLGDLGEKKAAEKSKLPEIAER